MASSSRFKRFAVIGTAALVCSASLEKTVGVSISVPEFFSWIKDEFSNDHTLRTQKLAEHIEQKLTFLSRESNPEQLDAAVDQATGILCLHGLNEARFADMGMSAEKAAEDVMQKASEAKRPGLSEDNRSFQMQVREVDFNQLIHDIIRAFYEAVPKDEALLKELLPHLWKSNFTKLRVIAETQQTEARKNELRHRELLAAINRDKGVPILALKNVIAKLEEIHVGDDPDALLEHLDKFANDFLALKEQSSRPSNDPPHIQDIRKGAEQRLDEGDIEGAKKLFLEASQESAHFAQEQMELAEQNLRSAASDRAHTAEAAKLQLNYLEAAEHYAEAAELLHVGDEELRRTYIEQQASVLYDHGREFGDNQALRQSIDLYKSLISDDFREADAHAWARLQNNLGNVLSTLGERESDTTRLEEAELAYKEALKERMRDRVPLDWAMTQNNLGTVQHKLGGRGSDTTRLEEAVMAYKEALKEYTRDRVPLNWAMTQNNLGIVLSTLGERESDTTRLEATVVAYKEALKERTRERVPLDWSMTQNNLGIVLSTLGARENDPTRLEASVVAYKEALKEWTRDRVPLNWAMTQNNLGIALSTLGERESNTTRLEESVVAYKEALKEWTRDRVPLNWATTQNNLGNVLSTLGERESDTTRLEAAVEAYKEALKEWTRERVPLNWATTQNNLGSVLSTLGERESNTKRLEASLAAFKEALKERTRERVPLDWAASRGNLAEAQIVMSEQLANPDLLVEASSNITEAIQELSQETHAPAWAQGHRILTKLLIAEFKREYDESLLDSAQYHLDIATSLMVEESLAPWREPELQNLQQQINDLRQKLA